MMILVTGATGFVGRYLSSELLLKGYHVAVALRRDDIVFPVKMVKKNVADLTAQTDWNDALEGVDVVVHTAARVHIKNDSVLDPLLEFRKVNVEGALNLARQAANSGVKRFIFLSSIKVNGEMTTSGQPFKPEDIYTPTDPYGLSKYEAEQSLLELAKETAMEVVIIRPPLVYGPSVKANFLSMIKWVNKGVPLPLGGIHNQRSLVALDNLTSFIICCIDHPKAANEVFLISDGEDVSITMLICKIAKAFDRKVLLIPMPVWLMVLAAKLIGKGDIADRLFGSLQVDSSKARDLLGWKPVVTMDEQLKKTVEAFLNEKTI